MYDRTQWHSAAERQICLQEETHFLLEFLHSDSVSAHTVSIDHLQRLARVRLCLDMTAELLVNRLTSAGKCLSRTYFTPTLKEQNMNPVLGPDRSFFIIDIGFLVLGVRDDPLALSPEFFNSVVDLCCRSGNDWYRVYLIRKICSLHGVEYVQKLLPQEEFRWLFPREILQSVGFS